MALKSEKYGATNGWPPTSCTDSRTDARFRKDAQAPSTTGRIRHERIGLDENGRVAYIGNHRTAAKHASEMSVALKRLQKKCPTS